MWKKESKRQETAKSEQKHRKKQEQKAKRIAEHLYIDEILPLVDFEETLGAGVMEDGFEYPNGRRSRAAERRLGKAV